jgi:transposase InsO family protein
LGVTAHPNAGWIAQQLTEAYGWKETPRYLIRDRDSAYGEIFIRRVGAMGIRDRPIAPRSPWQNGYAERLIGTIRRDCLDHVIVLANDTFVTCFSRIRDTTMRLARICLCKGSVQILSHIFSG